MSVYPHSIVVTSHSKDLSLPGERIGHVAVNPQADDAKRLVDGIILCTRILGYVNAPALMQRTVAKIQGLSVDVEIYEEAGPFLLRPELPGLPVRHAARGVLHFSRAPGGDDLAFVKALQEELVLVVPGRGFSFPGTSVLPTAWIRRSSSARLRASRRWPGSWGPAP